MGISRLKSSAGTLTFFLGSGVWGLIGLCGLLVSPTAAADPWAVAGNPRLRSDIQLLADSGVISAPVMAWPIPWGAIKDGLDEWQDAGLVIDPEALAAFNRISRHLDLIYRSRGWQPTLSLEWSNDENRLRGFADDLRDEGIVLGAGASRMGSRLAFSLRAQHVADPGDGQEWRLDGSYGAIVLGNHILSAGAMDRWWGPGWQGSLVYSSNARPIPALGVERNVAYAFSNRWLVWLGPWSYKVVFGQLESGREVPDARFLGLHLSARPLPDLEVAVSRTAQWCGQGRPCDLSTFLDLLVGRDNRGDDGISLENEPGNQLASIDIRWQSPLGDAPYALYVQATAEDEAGGFPSRWIALGGVETWGRMRLDRFSGNWRAHLEFSETAAEFYSETRFNYAYEHFIYQDGYRYKGRAIGHALDADSRSIAAGIVLAMDDGTDWTGLLRWGVINRDGKGGVIDARHSVTPFETEFLELKLDHSFSLSTETLRLGRITLGAGVLVLDEAESDSNETHFSASARWSWDFRSP